MNQFRIIELYARKLSKEATEEELSELYALMKGEDDQLFFSMLDNWWEAGQQKNSIQSEEIDAHFNKIIAREEPPNAVKQPSNLVRLIKPFAVAASLLGIAIVSYNLFFNAPATKHLTNVSNEIVAKRGAKTKLILPDGSVVWLNSDSKLSYNEKFNESVREVDLEGEAFFDVVKDKNRPFIVKTSALKIKVLGTAFNVKSYKQDATIEATLVRGLIEVEKTNEPNASKIFLKPNEKLVYNKTRSNQSDKETIAEAVIKPQLIYISTLPANISDSLRSETSWIYGRLVFEGDNFIELAQKMERWYNVKINIESSELINHRFRGAFEKENIEEALQALQLIINFKYTINKNEINITNN
jgi:ferric-dicitrate binding protein FerR (iron transport regulator)